MPRSGLASSAELGLPSRPALSAHPLPARQDNEIAAAHRMPATTLRRRCLWWTLRRDLGPVAPAKRSLTRPAFANGALTAPDRVLLGHRVPVATCLTLLPPMRPNVVANRLRIEVLRSHAHRLPAQMVDREFRVERTDEMLVRPAMDTGVLPVHSEGRVALPALADTRSALPHPAAVSNLGEHPVALFWGKVPATDKGFHMRSIHA